MLGADVHGKRSLCGADFHRRRVAAFSAVGGHPLEKGVQLHLIPKSHLSVKKIIFTMGGVSKEKNRAGLFRGLPRSEMPRPLKMRRRQ